MSYALLFPGQASQSVGMGRDLVERWPEASRVYDIAESAAGLPVRRLCFDGPEEELIRTVNLQPCVVATSLAVLAAAYAEAGLEIGDRFPPAPAPPLAVAGHSVGEYAALAAAGSLAIGACLGLVAERARLMQRAADTNPGTMLALIGGDLENARRLCAAVREQIPGSYLQIANLNSPGQTVLAGDPAGIDAARAAAADHGFRRTMPIPVSGAFHSAAMEPAVHDLRAALARAEILDAAVPVVANIDADMKTDAGALRAELAGQVISPVRWSDSVASIAAAGVSTFMEVGPGDVLSRLTARIVPDAQSDAIGDAGAVPRLAARLVGASGP